MSENEAKPNVGDTLYVETDDGEDEYPIDEVGDQVMEADNITWNVKAGGDWFRAEWDEDGDRWFAPKEETESEDEE